MLYWYLRVRNWLEEREEGQDLIEYALLVVLIAVVVIAGLEALGPTIKGVFTGIDETLKSLPS